MIRTFGHIMAMREINQTVQLENKRDENMSMLYFNKGRIQDVAALLEDFLQKNSKQFALFLKFSNTNKHF